MTPTDYFDDYCRRYSPYKNGAWCYEDGCIYRGLLLLHEATQETRWLDHLMRLCSAQVRPDGTLAGYDPDAFNIDNILAGRVLLPLARLTGESRYRTAAAHLIGQLERHPRIPAGNYWHKKHYPHQVWLDGLYMALPFQVEYALATGEHGRVRDALKQFETALAYTDAGHGLHVHGYDDSRQQAWADPLTGKSMAVWARAMGWLAMAMADVLDCLRAHPQATALREAFRRVLSALSHLQRPSGLWLQVQDRPDLLGNYEESSASAMFSYALLRGARLRLFSEEDTRAFEQAGRRGVDALAGERLVGSAGSYALQGICLVAGLGPYSDLYRDGSPQYYLSEPVVSDDAKGVGPFMMCWAETIAAGSLQPA